MKITCGTDIIEIKRIKESIEQLENANKLKNDNFDLKKLDDCTKDSYVEFKIDQNTNEIIATEYHLNCK